MISLALDTATERCTVAATDGVTVAHRFVDGARRHAGVLLGLIDELLHELGSLPGDIGTVVMADGPGSFTGLRVAAAVAKALSWRRTLAWRVAPSLLARAAAHAPTGGGNVLALSDALRGELYAGCWQVTPGHIALRGGAPRAVPPGALNAWRPIDVVVGSIPAHLLDQVVRATGCEPVTGERALPDARILLALVGVPGATTLVADPSGWEPEYGRPAEAQVLWERTHGRQLPASPGLAR